VEAFAVSNAAILAVADELARAHHRGDPGQTRPAARGGGAGLRRLPAGQPVPRRHRCPGPPPTGRGRRDCNFKVDRPWATPPPTLKHGRGCPGWCSGRPAPTSGRSW
jgi:hypothetical protein